MLFDEDKRYNKNLKTVQQALDMGIRAAGLAAALLLAGGLAAASGLPAQPAAVLKK